MDSMTELWEKHTTYTFGGSWSIPLLENNWSLTFYYDNWRWTLNCKQNLRSNKMQLIYCLLFMDIGHLKSNTDLMLISNWTFCYFLSFFVIVLPHFITFSHFVSNSPHSIKFDYMTLKTTILGKFSKHKTKYSFPCKSRHQNLFSFKKN